MKPYFQDPWITLYHGDCREIVPQLGKFDLLLTDPPYGIDVGNNQSSKETRAGLLVKGSYASYSDTPENYKLVVVPAISESLNHCQRGAVFGFAPNIFLLPPPQVVSGIFVPAGCGRNKWGWTTFMPVLFYGCAPNLQLGAKPTAIESTDTAEKNGHPTPKPLTWFTWLVSLGSAESETILDPFAGSGTTGRAAKDLGRRCTMIEREEKYCEIAARRCEQNQLFAEPPKEKNIEPQPNLFGG